MIKSVFIAAALCSTIALVGSSALAEDITVEMDKTQLLTVSVAPATIVVGNPSIADVTVNGSQVFLQGNSFGTTNIVMLDANGSQIASLDVTVKQSRNNGSVVFSAGLRQTYSCTPNCEAVVAVGDSASGFGTIMGQTQDKRAAALGIQPQRYSGVGVSAPANQQPAESSSTAQ